MKKIKLAAFGLVLLLALSACGKKEVETTAPVTEAVTEAPAETKKEVETTAAPTTEAVTEASEEAAEVTEEAAEEASDKEKATEEASGEEKTPEETSDEKEASAENKKEAPVYVDDVKKTGRYNLFAIGEDGEYFNASELMGDGAYMEILEGGKGSIRLDEKAEPFTWEEKNGKIIIEADGEKVECTIENGIAFLALDEGAGMYLAKPGADTSGIQTKGLDDLLGEMLTEQLESMAAEELTEIVGAENK